MCGRVFLYPPGSKVLPFVDIYDGRLERESKSSSQLAAASPDGLRAEIHLGHRFRSPRGFLALWSMG